MAKPPSTPPSSDVEGVDRDRTVDDIQDGGHPEPGGQLDRQKGEDKARPAGTDHTEGDKE